jgi:DHHC palmitoyltransferase
MTITDVIAPTPAPSDNAIAEHARVSIDDTLLDERALSQPSQPIEVERVSTTNTVRTTTPLDTLSWTYIANNDDNDMVRRWKESPFAVGLTHSTWKEEPILCCSNCKSCWTPINITSIFCRHAGRVGNMVVLLQRNEPYTDPITSRTLQRPKLICILGPYWMVLFFVTLPIFSLLSLYTGYSRMKNESTLLITIYMISTGCLFFSLLMVGCRDPGILYRHPVPPPSTNHNNNTVEAEWIWNDQALTFRPSHAKYDPECAVLIEHFDHTCPWTGTAIGRKNICWFRIFVIFILIDILFNAILLTFL